MSSGRTLDSSMTTWTTSRTVTFHRPFYLKGVDRLLPSFPAYRRVWTGIFVQAPSGSAVEMATIDPADLQAAQEQDAAMPNSEPATAR
jgi:hypothetical protein